MQAEIYNYPDFITVRNSIGGELKRAGVAAAAVAVGVFDGVHRGHRELIGRLKEIAGGFGGFTAVLTFDPHPKAVVSPERPPSLLVPLTERIRLLREAGADAVWVARFNTEFAALSPDAFLNAIFEPRAGVVRAVGVGSNWRFGCRAAGDVARLRSWCEGHDIICAAVPELFLDGEVVSSSSVRRAVSSGNLGLAERLLGRRYALCGEVGGGFRIAGAVLDHPTANIAVKDGVLPPDGVYAGYVETDGEECKYAAAVNIGFSPTFQYADGRRRVEAHLLGFSGNLYGRNVRLTLVRYLRPERSFADAAALKAQIEKDIEEICGTIKTII